MAAAIVASGLWRIVSRPIRSLSPHTRAQIIFGLRVGPVAAALVFVFAFVVPAYLLHEPEDSGEVVSGKLAVLAIISSIAVCLALYRVFRSWRVTRQLVSSWQRNAEELSMGDSNIPIFRIVHPFPLMAVVGIVRPRIFVAEQVLSTLSPDEFRAAVAHEYGHLRSGDNFKQTVLRVCRDLIILPLGGELDRAWADNVESAADEFAARSGRSTALDLASALIKLVRIAPRPALAVSQAGSNLLDEDNIDVTTRVRRLLSFNGARRPAAKKLHRTFSPQSLIWSAALTGLLAMHLIDQRLLLRTHEAIERFVSIIQ